MNKYDVLIIGNGLEELQCGYILSKQGYNVCIAEKVSQFRGCLQFFTRVWSCNGLGLLGVTTEALLTCSEILGLDFLIRRLNNAQ